MQVNFLNFNSQPARTFKSKQTTSPCCFASSTTNNKPTQLQRRMSFASSATETNLRHPRRPNYLSPGV